MVEMSPELVVVVMFGAVAFGIFLGCPLPFVVAGVAMFLGLAAIGPGVFSCSASASGT